MIKTSNKHIAVEPFKKAVEKERAPIRGIDITDASMTTLLDTVAIFDSESYKKGTKVYFSSTILKMPQSRLKYQLGETVFLLIPEDLVIVSESQ